MECLTETVYYDEIGLSYSKLLQDVKDFFALLKHYKVVVDEITSANVSINIITYFSFCFYLIISI